MKPFSIFVWTLLVCSSGLVYSQKADRPEPPPGPLIQKRAPDYSHWTITSKPLHPSNPTGGTTADNQKGGEKPEIPKYVVTKTGKLIHVELPDNQNQIWNIWCEGSMVVAVWPDGKNVGFAARPTQPDGYNPFYIDFSQSDFQGFEWISAKNFRGIKEVMGKKCLIFTRSGAASPDIAKESGSAILDSQSGSAVACIDLETRLPVALTNDSGLSVYQFQSPPTAMQTLPPNAQEMLDKQIQAVKALARRPSRPY